MQDYDVIIIGAGAAGLFCAIEAGKRGRRVLLLDHANKVGKKILMSGGGRCNFTNMYTGPEHFISGNEHFCKSALGRYSSWDFIALVEKHGIPYHEKKLGQLFCDQRSRDIVDMLLAECQSASVSIRTGVTVHSVEQEGGYTVASSAGSLRCESLVIATGGLSIPSMGASGFGYRIAEQFGIVVHPTRPGLVPFTLHPELLNELSDLSGLSADTLTGAGDTDFRENILFTHRGLSGPAILQISSYWRNGETVDINLLPELDVSELLLDARKQRPKILLKTLLSEYLPNRLVDRWCALWLPNKRLADLSAVDMQGIVEALQPWQIVPAGTEGYRTAEVTLGGVDTDAISSQTMQARQVKGLYFIGEVLDVTGHLGGHNFQWAWASAFAAGQYV